MATDKKTREQLREELPAALRHEYDRLIEDYRFASFEVHGKAFVSYGVLAKLVEAGWRRSGDDRASDQADASQLSDR